MQRRLMRLVGLASVLAVFALGTRAETSSSQRVRFAEVRPGDTLEVNYSAVGCFYSEAAEFIFRLRGHGEFSVTEIVRGRQPALVWERMPRGAVMLERGELVKLDRLLDHYRTPPSPDTFQLTGPPIPSLHLVHRRSGRVVATETLNDQGGTPGGEVLTFGEMLEALRKNARR
jgi:hypothetical protein